MSIQTLPANQFPTHGEALAYAQSHAKENGYALTVKRSNLARREYEYCCDKGSYQTKRTVPINEYASNNERKRERFIAQTGCEVSIYIRYSKKATAWLVTGKNEHNHEPSMPTAHAVHRRLGDDVKSQISNLLTSGASLRQQQLHRMLKQENPNMIATNVDIRNAISAAKMTMLDGLTHVEIAVKKLKELGMSGIFDIELILNY
jgi:hypothetical protein